MKLDQLPQIAEETLGGLMADEVLYQKIRKHQTIKQKTVWFPARRIMAFAGALVILLGIGALSPRIFGGKIQNKPGFNTQSAGVLPQVAALRAGNLPRGSITLGQPGDVPNYKGVWAASVGSNFPLIRVSGAFYRLLNNPSSIDSSLLGSSLGWIESFTEEPALDSSGQLLSNEASVGTQVFQISGMSGTAVAAEVSGKLRVFQRVSFSGSALLGSESLADTLRGSVAGLELSGVGTVTRAGDVSDLMNLLLNDSSYQNSSTGTSNQALLIQYSNGIVLQMAVKGNNLISCGTWNNPGFIEAFTAAVQ